MSAFYSARQMASEIERVIKVTREETLRVERERVARAIYLYANTILGEKEAEAVMELMAFLYESKEAADERAAV
jgi:hypothetical protein